MPLDFVHRALRPLRPVRWARLRSGAPFFYLFTILDHFRPILTFFDHLGQFFTIMDYFLTLLDPFGPFWTILDHFDEFLANLTIFGNC